MKSLLALLGIWAVLFATACTQSSEKLLAKGNQYHLDKKYKEASILYRKAIAKNKTNAEAYYREGLNLLGAGNSFEASKFLRRAVDLKPDNTDAEIKLAEIYLFVYTSNPKKFKSLLPEVRDLSSKILERQPDSFDGVRLQALLYLAANDIPKALESFAKADRLKPYSRNLVGWYAETLAAAKRRDEAEALIGSMLAHDKTWGPGYDFLFLRFQQQNSPEKAEAILRERVANDPSSSAAITNLSSYLLATDRFSEGETLMRRVSGDRKGFPDGRELLGDFYLRAKKFDQALEQYQLGAKQDQKNALQYEQRIVAVYSLMGRRDDAVHLAKSLAETNPKDIQTNRMYASLLLETGAKADVANSLTELRNLVRKTPGDPTLHLDLARAYFTQNEKDKSLSEALEAAREQPNLLLARVLAARIYEDRGQHAKSLDQTAVTLASQPANADARLIRCRALIGLNESDRALPELEAIVQQYPQMNDARLALGNLYLSRSEYAKASEEFEHMGKSNPPDDRGYIGLQSVKLAQGKGDEAIAALEQLAQKKPSVLSYRYQLANVEAAAGIAAVKSNPEHGKQLFRQAADHYKQILTSTKGSSDLWMRLGVTQREIGDAGAALASFQQAAKTDPQSGEAFLNEGMLLDSLGRKKEAIEAYNKALGIDPNNALALNNVAFLNAQSGTNLDEALTFAERAKKKYPNNIEISDTLGFIYLQKNLNPEAMRIFREIVQDNPKNATFRLHLAMALLRQGDKQGARAEAGKALKTAAGPDEQTKIRSFVSRIG